MPGPLASIAQMRGPRAQVAALSLPFRRCAIAYPRSAMTSRADGSVDLLDTICFVHWSARPDANEVQRVVDGIGTARRTAGHPLVLIALVPDNAERPDREGREALHRLAQIVDRMCDAQYAVFHGGTIRARIVRAFLVAIGLAMRSAVEVVADVETALQLAGARLGVDPAVLIDRARTRGIIERAS